MIQQSGETILRTRDGGRHIVRGPAVKADRHHPGRVPHGKGYERFRRDIMGMAKNARRQVWITVNLHERARKYKRCLSTMRAYWRRLADDPVFFNNMGVRVKQVRLDRNGCPEILCAHNRNRLYDLEPLLYERDLVTKRHVRSSWRSPDIEEQARDSLISDRQQYRGFSSFGTAVQNNVTRDENQSTGPPPDTPSEKSIDLDGRQTEFNDRSSQTFDLSDSKPLKSTLPGWQDWRPLSIRGKKRLSGKARWLLLQCRGRYWDNCKVQWNGGHAWIFCMTALRDGHEALTILRAWDYGVHTAHADETDGLARVPSALCLAHARRWLAERTKGTQSERVSDVYKSIPFRIKKDKKVLC